MINPLIICGILILMMPHLAGGGSSRDFNYRIPPAWDPANEHNYSYRAYMTDLSIWTLLTDLQPHQQAAAIIMRLQGTAREFARMIQPQEIMHGGIQNGVHVDPVTYILAGLHARFSPLEEESRLSAMTEMMAFARKPGESINAVLSRYEIVRQRAALEGQFTMPIGGQALQLFRSVGMNPQQMMTILQPLGGQLPTNDQEFNMVCQQLRRYGHITENYPGNIGQALHGPFRQARPGAYFAEGGLEAAREAAQRTTSGDMHTYFGNNRNNHDPQMAAWDAAPQLLYDPAVNPASLWDTGDDYAGQTYGDGAWESQWADPGGGQWADSEDTYAFPVDNDWQSDPSSSATSSDYQDDEIEMPDLSSMTDADAAEMIYLQYRKAKRTWRRFTGRPVRRFRRRFKKFMRKGKGKGKGRKGKGKGKGFMYTRDDMEAFLAKGGGKRPGSSGKGKGRRKNPRGRDGNIMKCRICDSDEHFQRECPHNTGGKGKGKSGGKGGASFMPFVAPSDATGGQCADGGGMYVGGSQGADAHDSDHPPWQDHDSEQFLTSNMFMAYQHDGTDPFLTNDPWLSRSRGRTSSGFEMLEQSSRHRSTASSSGYQPTRSRPSSPRPAVANPFGSPAGNLRVEQGDELSDSDTSPAPPVRDPVMSVSANPFTIPYAPPRGYATPTAPYPMTPLGMFNTWQHRTTGTPINDSVLQRLYQSSQMSASTRQQQPYFHSHLLRHQYPISVAASNSVRQTDRVTSPMMPVGPGPLQRVYQAIGLAQTYRDQRENRRSYYDRAAAAPAEANEPTPAPEQPLIELIEPEVPEPTAPPAEVVPTIQQHLFEETDRCSICQKDFEHGERVCRITCMHVFHADCWSGLHAHADGERQNDISCPNCRSSNSQVIAVWPWVSRLGPVTQDVNGFVPTNQLGQSSDTRARARTSSPTTRASHSFYTHNEVYHINTQLADGRPAILVDPGSVGNLCGEYWAEKVANTAKRAGLKPTYQKRSVPLTVSGVGNGSQHCNYDCSLPVSLRHADQPDRSSNGVLTIPSIANSSLPGLLGLNSLRKNRAVLDFTTLRLHFCGPGDNEMEKSLPAGTDTFQLELAPSGHLVLPCCEYDNRPMTDTDYSLTLVAKSDIKEGGSQGADTQGVRGAAAQSSSSSSSQEQSASRRIPPAPVSPPRVRHEARPMGPPPAGHA